MRRNHTYQILLIVSLAAALMGCRREPLPETGNAILFSVASVEASLASTKADVPGEPLDPASLVTNTSKAKLYGEVLLSGASAKTPIFGPTGSLTEVTTLTCTDAPSNTWSYDPLKYWEKGATYDFRAVFPESANPSGDSDVVTVSYTMSKTGYDLMVAAAHDIHASTQAGTAVPLTFRHACAAVRFLFKKSGNETGFAWTINSFELQNLYTTKNMSYAWSATDSKDILTWSLPDGATRATSGIFETTSAGWEVNAEYDYFTAGQWYYVVPQDLYDNGNKPMVKIEYQISDVTTDPVKVIDKIEAKFLLPEEGKKDGTDVTISSWEPGKMYIYKINLANTTISVSVANWDPEKTVTVKDIIFGEDEL